MKRDKGAMKNALEALHMSSLPSMPAADIHDRADPNGVLDYHEFVHHLLLLQDSGFTSNIAGDVWRLTNDGHELVETAEAEGSTMEIWKKLGV